MFLGFYLIVYQVKPLGTIEWELSIAGNKREALCKGMGNNDMVAWVIMLLSFVDAEMGICVAHISTDWKKCNPCLRAGQLSHRCRASVSLADDFLSVFVAFALSLQFGVDNLDAPFVSPRPLSRL